MHLPEAGLALFWGVLSAFGLIIGGLVGYYATPGRRTVAWITAFSSGAFITVIAFDLIEEAYAQAGLVPTGLGFLSGAIIFTLVAVTLAKVGARRRGGAPFPAGPHAPGALVVGIIMDNTPESIVIGLSLIDGTGVALPTVVGIFMANIPEAISASAGLKNAGRTAGHVFTLWIAIIVLSGAWALAGYALFADLHPAAVAVIQSIAAGALLAMVADTAIPEAFAEAREETGLAASLGFLAGFALSHGL